MKRLNLCTGQPALQIDAASICRDVVDRAPVGVGDVFSKEQGKLFCFTRIVGAALDTTISHNWYYQETLMATVPLAVRSSDWRTYSSKTLLPEWTGEWKVEVVDQGGMVLTTILFLVQ